MHFRYSPKADINSPPWLPPLSARTGREQVQQKSDVGMDIRLLNRDTAKGRKPCPPVATPGLGFLFRRFGLFPLQRWDEFLCFGRCSPSKKNVIGTPRISASL
jgi:hypothetical protein